MPRSKRKGRPGGAVKGFKVDASTSDDDSVNDTASVVSAASESRSYCDEVVAEEVDEQSQEELFEEKLKEDIDGATQKSAAGRVSCLDSVSRAFSHKFIPEFVQNRRMTMVDCIERSLRKGKGPEQASAAHLASLLCLQLGAGDDGEVAFREIQPILLLVALDANASASARARCCSSLGLCSFLCGGGDLEAEDLLETLESFLRSSLTTELGGLQAAAVGSWSLLLTLLHPSRVALLASSHIPLLARLLDSPDLDLRIMAGEALALVLEMAREAKRGHEEEDEEVDVDAHLQLPADLLPLLADKLHQLATDSHKYRAKKDRKQQRSSFRDILRGVEEHEAPCVQVRFGPEALILNSWRRKRQYDAICQALGSGTNIHLASNDLVREIFELGNVLPLNAPVQKISKFERHMMNVSAFKARTLTRGRNRDKRSVVVAY